MPSEWVNQSMADVQPLAWAARSMATAGRRNSIAVPALSLQFAGDEGWAPALLGPTFRTTTGEMATSLSDDAATPNSAVVADGAAKRMNTSTPPSVRNMDSAARASASPRAADGVMIDMSSHPVRDIGREQFADVSGEKRIGEVVHVHALQALGAHVERGRGECAAHDVSTGDLDGVGNVDETGVIGE